MFAFNYLDEKTWKLWAGLKEQSQRALTQQQILPGNPGTILTDVESMLELVGPQGIVIRKGNATLPPDRLPELNGKSSHPLELALQRPLLRDYPNLAGIFILLRVMDLLQFQDHRLAVSAEALAFWRALNPTEQYFALLEALLFQARPSVLAIERRADNEQAYSDVIRFLSQLNERWHKFDRYESAYEFGPKGKLRPWSLFVQQQLGLVELRPLSESEQKGKGMGGRGWLLSAARLTPWGTALTWALLDHLKQADDQEAEDAREEAAREAVETEDGPSLPLFGPLPFDEPADKAVDGVVEEEEGELEVEEENEPDEPEPEFGLLQPIFQPYFPEWQRVYARPQRAVRVGTHIFKVTLGGWRGDPGVWRRLAVPHHNTLDDLAEAILGAFRFDDDHFYDFRYRDERGLERVYNRPEGEEGPFTTDVTVGDCDLPLKQAMIFTFDYGDNWQFEVRLEGIEVERSRSRRPKIIEAAGKAPKQYESDW